MNELFGQFEWKPSLNEEGEALPPSVEQDRKDDDSQMTVHELNRDQLIELKQRMLIDRDEATFWSELAEADGLISDDEVMEHFDGYTFTPEDFLEERLYADPGYISALRVEICNLRHELDGVAGYDWEEALAPGIEKNLFLRECQLCAALKGVKLDFEHLKDTFTFDDELFAQMERAESLEDFLAQKGLLGKKPHLSDKLSDVVTRASSQASVKSVAHSAENAEIKDAVLQSDALRAQTLDACYGIPGYSELPPEDMNKLYDLVKKSISLSQDKKKAAEPERF